MSQLEMMVRFHDRGMRWPLRHGDVIEIWRGTDFHGAIPAEMIQSLVTHHLSMAKLMTHFSRAMKPAVRMAGRAGRRLVLVALLAGLAGLVSGCTASGPLAPMPVVTGPAATIVFARPSILFDGGGTLDVMIDGQALYGLKRGKHVSFPVAPGEHIVGIRDLIAISGLSKITTVTLQAAAGQTYYFRLTNGSPVEFARVTEREGRALMTDHTTPAPQPAGP